MTDLLTLQDVADRLHVSHRTVRRLVTSGQLRIVKVGRRPLVTEREYEAFIAAASRQAA